MFGEIGELLGEEHVPLLERGELLERERVDPAELCELALGAGEAALLLVAGERARLVVLVLAGNRDVGAVLRDEHVLAEAELGLGALHEPGHVQLLLVDAQLEAVHVLGDRVQSLTHRGLLASHALELLVAARSLGLRTPERDAGLGDGGVDGGEGGGQRLGDARGRLQLCATDDGAARGIRCGLLLGLELALHRPHPRLLGAHALLRRLEPEACLDLALTSLFECGERAIAHRDVEHGACDGRRGFERGLRLVGGALRLDDALLRGRGRVLESRCLGDGRLRPYAGAIELLGALGELGVELAEGRKRPLRLLLRVLEDRALLGELVPGALDERAHLLEAGTRAVALGDELDAALLTAGAAADDVAPHQGAVLGDDGDGRVEAPERGFSGAGRGEIVGDQHFGEERDDAVGGGDHIGGRYEPAHRVRKAGVSAGLCEGERDPPEFASLGVLERAECSGAIVDEHRVGERTERGRDRGLVAGLDVQRLGEESSHAVDVRRDERCRAVLLVERERECGRAGRERALFALTTVQLLADAFDFRLRLEHGRLRELVGLVETGLRAIGRLRLALDTSEFRGGGVASGTGRLEGVRVPQHLSADRCELGGGRVGLSGEPRELEVVGGDASALRGDALVDDIERVASALRRRPRPPRDRMPRRRPPRRRRRARRSRRRSSRG